MSHIGALAASLSICLVMLLATPLSLFTASATELLPGTLARDQIERLFTDRTAVALTPDQDELLLYFDRDGIVRQVRDGLQSNGTWSVRKDSRLCVEINEDRDCRAIARQGDTYLQYVVKKDGTHRPDLSYIAFSDGEQLARLSKSPILPVGTLNSREVTALFSDQTVESVTADRGRTSLTYYASDGGVVQLRNGQKRVGTWRVTQSGRMCLQMEGSEEKCRVLVAEGGEIRKYIVKKNGHHQHSVSYRKFTPGKTFR